VTWSEVQACLKQRPGAFDFFQAVRILRGLHGERVRFRSNTELDFPASQIEALMLPESGSPELAVNFLGLAGPMAALPYFYSELVNDRARAKDFAPRAFLDIFHHRLTALFFEAWEKHRFPAVWEQGEDDVVSSALLALLGIRTEGMTQRQEVSDSDLSFYAGLLAMQSRPLSALQQILEDYFAVRVRIDQFCGTWFMLPETDQCRLGNESCFEQLDEGAILGDAVWNQQSRVRVRMGPMPLERYQEFLPGGPAYKRAEALLEFFANRQFEWELQLVLDRSEVPSLALGSELPLDWCSWLKTDDFQTDPDDARLPIGQQLCTSI
jgi:type VI secretion system protein ImpH